jgi:hypothetical protein
MDEHKMARLENQIENALEVNNLTDLEAAMLLTRLAVLYAQRANQFYEGGT